jgi:hypothetical protein
MSRADKLSFQRSTNFARASIYPAPGQTPKIISIPSIPVTIIQDKAHDNFDQMGNASDDDDYFLMAENSGDDVDIQNPENLNEETEPPVLVDEEESDNEVDEDEAQMLAAEEMYQDFNMAEILGQTEVLNFNFLSGTTNDIERRVREITFPRVVILVRNIRKSFLNIDFNIFYRKMNETILS